MNNVFFINIEQNDSFLNDSKISKNSKCSGEIEYKE
jgi:hypothetical protein